MKVLVDTNVILDAIAAREPFRAAAEEIVLLVAQEKIKGWITATSITDIYYIARKKLSDKDAREAIRNLMNVFSVIEVGGEDCEIALDLPMDDYEDALVAVCGKKAKIDYIVTRDKEFLAETDHVPTISPRDFVTTIQA